MSAWLSRAVGEQVSAQAVLVLPGWYIERKSVGDVLVMSHKDVQAAIPKARTAHRLSPEQIRTNWGQVYLLIIFSYQSACHR